MLPLFQQAAGHFEKGLCSHPFTRSAVLAASLLAFTSPLSMLIRGASDDNLGCLGLMLLSTLQDAILDVHLKRACSASTWGPSFPWRPLCPHRVLRPPQTKSCR